MSEVITDKLTGRATAGDVTITSEGGSATMQLQQGVAKCWGNIAQGTTSSPAVTSLEDSLNCSSITDDATGKSSITRTNNMNNDDYSTTGAVMANRVGMMGANTDSTYSTSVNQLVTCDSRDANHTDYNKSCFQIMGDLA